MKSKRKQWDYPRLSYSRLSSFVNDGPFSLIKKRELESRALSIGELVDDLLFISTKEFNKKYIINKAKTPTATLKLLADIIIDICIKEKKKVKELDIIKIIKTNNFWSSIKKETVLISKFDMDFFYAYINEKIKAKTKNLELISGDMLQEAKELVRAIRTDKNINYNFHNKNKNIENIFQYKLQFTYQDIKFLGYIDILQINHKNKTIQIKDLKTTSTSVKKFTSSFLKYNYYIQGGLYSLGIEQIIKDLKLEGYEILPFEFIYSSFLSNSTITYVFVDKWLSGSINGFHANGRYYKGIKEIIHDIKWHFDNDVFSMNRFLYENNSKIEIPSDFIKITEDRNEGE